MKAFCRWVLLYLLVFAPLSLAQIVQTLPDLDIVSDGVVLAMAKQSNGALIVGGQFTSINGVNRRNIARLLADGSLDPLWDPRVDGTVLALTVDSDGTVYAGGNFTHVDGVALPNLAKIPGTGVGAAVATWVPAPDSAVRSLAVSGFTLYVGGDFQQVGGIARAHLARLATAGIGTPDAWNPSANASVYALSVVVSGFGGDGVIAGGNFTEIGGQTRNRLAKLSTTTSTVDPAWNPSVNSTVTSLTNDGVSIFAGGYFTMIGNLARNRVAKLPVSGSGVPVAAFNANANDFVESVSLVSNTLYIGGWFTQCGGLARSRVARVSAITGAIDADWNPGPVSSAPSGAGAAIVYAIRGRSDGVATFGGSFRNAAGQTRLSLARIEADATSLLATHAERAGEVLAFARQSNGGILVGGNFALVDGQPRSSLLRLLPDGTLDPQWTPSVDGGVSRVALDGNGRVYVAGQFSSVNNLPLRGVARLAGSGTGDPDTSWNAGSDYYVRGLAIAADGSVVVGGSFTEIGGQPRNHLARLSADNAIADPSWNPDADNWIDSVAIDTDGAIFVGGSFTAMGPLPRAYVAKLSTSTGLADATWHPALNAPATTLALTGNGALYAGGYFNNVDGLSRNAGMVKLSTAGAGAIDAQWNPPLHGNPSAIVIEASGDLFVSGNLYADNGVGDQALDGPITQINKLDNVTGARRPNWYYSSQGSVFSLLLDRGRLLVGGNFEDALLEPRSSLASLAIDRLFANGFQ